MPKMVFGLDRFYKHTKSNRSNMLAWNELHDVKGQLGPFTDLGEGVLHLCLQVAGRFDSLKPSLELGMFILDHPLI